MHLRSRFVKGNMDTKVETMEKSMEQIYIEVEPMDHLDQKSDQMMAYMKEIFLETW